MPREHPLGVVAALLRLDHRRLALGEEAGQQDRALHLGARHLEHVARAAERAAPHHHRREPVALARAEVRAHPPERVDHAPDRPAPQRGVAGEHRQARDAGEHAGEEPQAGPGVPAVDHVARLAERLGGRHHHLGPLGPHPAPSASTALRVEWTSSASSRPVTRVSPVASAPKRRLRCEMDLSPGTVDGPAERPGAAAGERTVQGKSSSRAARASSSAARAASGDSAMAARMRREVPLEPARRRRHVGVPARHLALDVEGERGEPGHVLEARAGQLDGERPGLARRGGERRGDQVGQVRDHRHRGVVLGGGAALHLRAERLGGRPPPARPPRAARRCRPPPRRPSTSRRSRPRSRRARRTWGARRRTRRPGGRARPRARSPAPWRRPRR